MSKKIIAIIMSLVMVMALAACGSSPVQQPAETAPSSEETETTAEVKADPVTVSADEAVVGISTLGFVDTDGAKVQAIVVEYNVDLSGADLNLDMFEVEDYGMEPFMGTMTESGSDPGVPVKIYVNDKPEISEEGGSGSGNYVIIEVNSDYHFNKAMRYQMAMAAGVQQIAEIESDGFIITPASEKVLNYAEVPFQQYGYDLILKYAFPNAFSISGIEGYELHTVDEGGMEPFHATGCFDEATGESSDVDICYALYVPEDYDASKEYALIVHIPDAGVLGTDPMLGLTSARGPYNYASDEVQQILKDQGLGGAIVLCPIYPMELRSTRDNWSLSAAVPATWQLIDSLIEEYSISEDRIYGTGQSMGGMQILAMSAQRDNFFAAQWLIGCQWGSNYGLDTVPYYDALYYPAPADGKIIWTKDADGNDCDYRDLYYLISDDNILITNCSGDKFSTGTWKETDFLYRDTVGTEIPKAVWNPLTDSIDTAENTVKDLVNTDNGGFGMYWAAMEGGSHESSWLYVHANIECYRWFLTQTRSTEMSRSKLDINKPFELADEQIINEERLIASNPENGDSVYFVTAKKGSGTNGYNAAIYAQSGSAVLLAPAWTLDNYQAYQINIPTGNEIGR